MNDKLTLTIQERLSKLPSGLIKHIRTVETISVDFATIHIVNKDRARLCAQAHDLFRSEKPNTLINMAQKLGIKINSVELELPILLHERRYERPGNLSGDLLPQYRLPGTNACR